jgi:toxin ParE1/3/4
MKIRWSPEAADDLERICERIAIDNHEAANRVAGTIYEGCEPAKGFSACRSNKPPYAGMARVGIPSAPYIAVYLVTEEAVEITRIFHGAQDWP